MKALILAAGKGARIMQISANAPKSMVEVCGRPVIDYSLACAASASAEEIIIVVGYRAQDIIDHCGRQYEGIAIRYVNQPEQKGVVHAIQCAATALASHDFLLLLGDEVMVQPRHAEMAATFDQEDLWGLCGIIRVQDRERIRKTYSVILDSQQRITRLTEKPHDPPNDLMGTGQCIFRNAILDYIDATPVQQQRREKELPGLIQCAIDDGAVVKTFPICDQFANINSLEDLQYVRSILDPSGP